MEEAFSELFSLRWWISVITAYFVGVLSSLTANSLRNRAQEDSKHEPERPTLLSIGNMITLGLKPRFGGFYIVCSVPLGAFFSIQIHWLTLSGHLKFEPSLYLISHIFFICSFGPLAFFAYTGVCLIHLHARKQNAIFYGLGLLAAIVGIFLAIALTNYIRQIFSDFDDAMSTWILLYISNLTISTMMAVGSIGWLAHWTNKDVTSEYLEEIYRS